MITHARNKIMSAENIETKGQEVYHFAGGLKYKPQSVKASSMEEAQKIWEKTREK